MAKITMPTTVFDSIAFNDSHPLFPLLRYCSFVGLKTTVRGEVSELDNVSDPKKLTWANVQGVLAVGGEVIGFPAWFSISAATYAGNVPDVISRVVDEDGNTIAQPWLEWGLPNYPHVEISEKMIVPSNAYGSELDASILLAVETSTDIEILDTLAFKAASEAANPSVD